MEIQEKLNEAEYQAEYDRGFATGFFEYVRAFEELETGHIAIDPDLDPWNEAIRMTRSADGDFRMPERLDA